MRESLEPAWVEFVGIEKTSHGRRFLDLRPIQKDMERFEQPFPAACEVDLFPADGQRILGTATFFRDRFARGQKRARTSAGCLQVILPSEPSEDEAQFLLDLQTGKVEEVVLTFRPSRAMALKQPHCDEYWGGWHTMTIPVKPEGTSGIKFGKR